MIRRIRDDSRITSGARPCPTLDGLLRPERHRGIHRRRASQRLTLDGYIKPEWGVSDNNRRARYYTLTAAGRKHRAAERAEFERVVTAMRLVLDFA